MHGEAYLQNSQAIYAIQGVFLYQHRSLFNSLRNLFAQYILELLCFDSFSPTGLTAFFLVLVLFTTSSSPRPLECQHCSTSAPRSCFLTCALSNCVRCCTCVVHHSFYIGKRGVSTRKDLTYLALIYSKTDLGEPEPRKIPHMSRKMLREQFIEDGGIRGYSDRIVMLLER